MKIKSQPSTAQKLGLFRDALQRHYRSIRNDQCKPVPKPALESFGFGGYARACAHAIESEEKNKHEQAVAQLERQKEMNAQ